MQHRAAQTEPQDPLEAGPIHPPRCPGVPCPPAPADMWWFGINISGDDVGLDLVPVNASASARMVDGVQDCEELTGLVPVAECGERENGPDRGMGILTPVFADAGKVSFDVARVQVSAVEWRGEEEDEAVIATHEMLLDRCHGTRAARRLSGTRDDAPGLGDRIDAAFSVRGGAEWR